MRKVLILGCSHSLGSFKPHSEKKEYFASKDGWWSFVDVIKKDKKYVYAGAGLGWMFWSQLIFDKVIDIKDYDFCIIQNTHPGRLTVFKRNWYKHMSVEYLANNTKWHALTGEFLEKYCLVSQNSLMMSHILNSYVNKPSLTGKINIFKYIKYKIENYINEQSTLRFCLHIEESPTRHLVSFVHQHWLLDTLKKNKIPIYIINYGNKEKFSNAVTLNCNNCIKSLSSFRTHRQGHLTIEGNKQVGNLVNQELSRYVN